MWVIDDFDVPGRTGQSIGVCRRGLPPGTWLRMMTLGLLILVPMGAAAIVINQHGGLDRPVGWVGIGFAALCLVPVVAFLTSILAWTYTCRLVWDTSTGGLRVGLAAWAPWPYRNLQVPFSSLQVVRFTLGRERGEESPFHLCLSTNDAAWPGDLLLMQVQGVNDRAGIFDLAFRIARAMGWQAYLSTEDERGQMIVDLLPGRASAVNARAIPPEGEPLDLPAAS